MRVAGTYRGDIRPSMGGPDGRPLPSSPATGRLRRLGAEHGRNLFGPWVASYPSGCKGRLSGTNARADILGRPARQRLVNVDDA